MDFIYINGCPFYYVRSTAKIYPVVLTSVSATVDFEHGSDAPTTIGCIYTADEIISRSGLYTTELYNVRTQQLTKTSSGTVTSHLLNVLASKIATVAADVNQVASQANQDAISVSLSGDLVTISGNLSSLNSFASTVTAQGSGKWVGLFITTGLDSIIGAKFNDVAFVQSDIDEAESVGGSAGQFVLWLKADAIALTPRKFKLSEDGVGIRNITVRFVNA